MDVSCLQGDSLWPEEKNTSSQFVTKLNVLFEMPVHVNDTFDRKHLAEAHLLSPPVPEPKPRSVVLSLVLQQVLAHKLLTLQTHEKDKYVRCEFLAMRYMGCNTTRMGNFGDDC